MGCGNRNRNRKLEISTAPTKAKSWEPAYSQALSLGLHVGLHGVSNTKSIDSVSDPERQSGRWYGLHSTSGADAIVHVLLSPKILIN